MSAALDARKSTEQVGATVDANPTVGPLQRLAKALGVPVTALLEKEGAND